MDAEAIRVLQENTAELAQTLNGILDPVGKVAVPDGWSVSDIEGRRDYRLRFRADFKTHSLADWIAYVLAHDGTAHTRVYVQPDELTALAIFNEGDVDNPGHMDDRARLTLGKSAAYLGLLSIHGRTLTQSEFLDWLDDFAENITQFRNANDETLPHASALAGIRTLTLDRTHSVTSKQEDVRRELGELERIEVREAVAFPSKFVFSFTPAVGLSDALALVKITPTAIATREGAERKPPSFRLRVLGLDKFNEELAAGFKGRVAELLTTDNAAPVPVRIGTIAPGA